MKTTLRHYGAVALLLAGIWLVSTLLSLFTGTRREEDKPQVLVTAYPLYVAAQNILNGTDEIELTLLSGAGAGCLHDYQLTPADRLAIERADRVMTVTAGEDTPFLKQVDGQRLIHTAKDVEMLCVHGDHGHNHDHGQTDAQEYNEHVWLSPARYSQMTVAAMEALIDLDPGNASVYRENTANYMMSISGVASLLPNLMGRTCVLFHDSLAYLAEDLGLEVAMTLTVNGESGLSAADLAQVEQLTKTDPDLILLYDTQYPIRYGAVEGLVPATNVLALETAVVAEGKISDWLDAMTWNAAQLQTLKGGDTL